MADFSSGVSPPGGASYAAPLLSFQQFSNWAADDPYKKIFDRQQEQLNQQRLTQGQQAIDVAGTFKGGLPVDPATGQIDYKRAVAMLAQKGDIGALWNGADAMLSQSAMGVSPLLGGGGQPAAPGAAPASVAAKPLPPPAANSPRGDAGTGTIADIVTDRLPSQNQTTGQTIIKIAEVMGIDPNATLTPGQLRRAEGLLKKYAPEIAGQGGAAAADAPASFGDRFAGGDSGDLPPSANAVSAAPRPGAAPAPAGGPTQQRPGSPAPMQAAPVGAPGGPAAPAQPQAPQGGPIVPQVPLPPGYTDPQKAILALRAEAARLGANPRAAHQVAELNNYAQRIEQSLQPLSVSPNTTMIDPRTGQVLYQGAGAAMMGAAAAGGASSTLDADAELYRQTGKLPPNMGRGMQGSAEAKAIRARAVQQEIDQGGDPGDWSSRWQKFSTQAAGLRTLENRAAGLTLAENEAKTLIPRVRDISAKVSRTEYPNINKLILAAKKGSGGTDVIKLGVAIESLIPVYAKVLKPVGTVGAADMERAHDIVDKAWSDGQINAALDQMELELDSAKVALKKTQEEFGGRRDRQGGGDGAAPDSGSAAGAGKSAAKKVSPAGVSWSVE